MNVKYEDVLDVLINSGVSADVEGLAHDASLKDAGVDSLDISNFFLCLEEKFEIEIADEDIDLLDTIDAIVSYIEKL